MFIMLFMLYSYFQYILYYIFTNYIFITNFFCHLNHESNWSQKLEQHENSGGREARERATGDAGDDSRRRELYWIRGSRGGAGPH